MTTTETEDQKTHDKPYEKVARHTKIERWLWAAACRKAKSEGRTIGSVVHELLRGYVGRDKP